VLEVGRIEDVYACRGAGARRFSGSAALGAIGVCAGAGECTGLDDQVLLADRAAVELALEDLADSRHAARLTESDVPEVCGVMPWWGIVRQGWSFGAGWGNQTSPA
jgi:hypothetical protein